MHTFTKLINFRNAVPFCTLGDFKHSVFASVKNYSYRKIKIYVQGIKPQHYYLPTRTLRPKILLTT